MACKWNCSSENWDDASQSVYTIMCPTYLPLFHSFPWMKSFWLVVNLLTSQHVKFEQLSDQKFLIECTLQLYPLNQITWQTHPKEMRMKNIPKAKGGGGWKTNRKGWGSKTYSKGMRMTKGVRIQTPKRDVNEKHAQKGWGWKTHPEGMRMKNTPKRDKDEKHTQEGWGWKTHTANTGSNKVSYISKSDYINEWLWYSCNQSGIFQSKYCKGSCLSKIPCTALDVDWILAPTQSL